MIARDYKPRWTIWNRRTVRSLAIAHKRRVRRAARQYLRTGNIRDLNRSRALLTRRDFD